MEGILPGITIGCIFVFVLFLIGMSRKANVSSTNKPGDLVRFQTHVCKADVLRSVILYFRK